MLAALETTSGTTDRNIDVKYSSLQLSLTGSSTWADFGNSGGAAHADPNYTYAYVSNTAFNVYLAPLN